MNILYICPRFPFPPDQGDKLVIYNQLKFLSRGNDITLLTLMDNKKELEGTLNLSAYCTNVEAFKKRSNFSILNFIMAAYKRDPLSVIRYYSPEMFRRSKELIESGEFDIVHVAFYYMAPYVLSPNLKIPKKTALILETHIIEHMLYENNSRFTQNLLLKLFLLLEARRVRGCELAAYKGFDECLVFSTKEADDIKHNYPGIKVKVQMPIVDNELDYDKYTQIKEEENVLLFFGRLKTLPNEDAVRYFYYDILPFVKKEVPDVKLRIIGRAPTHVIRKIGREPNIELVGFVEDINVELRKAAIILVPMRVGGGIRLKILTAWAAGKAVVSTSAGAEGIPYKDGEDIAIADTPQDFSKKTVWLLRNPELRRKMGEAGYRNIKQHFNPDKVASEIINCYKEAINQKLSKLN